MIQVLDAFPPRPDGPEDLLHRFIWSALGALATWLLVAVSLHIQVV